VESGDADDRNRDFFKLSQDMVNVERGIVTLCIGGGEHLPLAVETIA